MIRPVALLTTVLVAAAWGQYKGLSTPSDGSVVYFVSSLQISGANQPTYGKLFAADETGVRLVRSMPLVSPVPVYPSTTCLLGSFYLFNGAETTSDGSVVSGTGARSSTGYCPHYNQAGTDLVSNSGDKIFNYLIRISPDGRHAIADTTSDPVTGTPSIAYIDLATGTLTPIAMAALPNFYVEFAAGGRTIANDGTAIYNLILGSYVVLPGGTVQQFPNFYSTAVAIDASGKKVLYWADDLRMYDLGSRQDTLVLPAFDLSGAVSMSDDASRVLVVRSGQAWVVGGDGRNLRQLTQDAAGIEAATLSGDGKVAYASTTAGRLLKIRVDTGDQVELVGRTPNFLPYLEPGPCTAGMPCTVNLRGLPNVSQGAQTPPALSLANTTVTVGGKAAPLLFVMPDHVDFLVPWDALSTPTTSGGQFIDLGVTAPADHSPFGGPHTNLVFENTVFAGGIGHQDWSGVVSDSSPAHVGEVVHVFATGLGAVNPEVQAGAPAPSVEPLSRLAVPLVCNGATVLYAGLAPGERWRVYQVDLRLGGSTGAQTLSCSLDGGQTWFGLANLTVAP